MPINGKVGGGVSSGDLDDYVEKAVDNTISAQHTFSNTGAPFIVNDSTVVGNLNSKKWDGHAISTVTTSGLPFSPSEGQFIFVSDLNYMMFVYVGTSAFAKWLSVAEFFYQGDKGGVMTGNQYMTSNSTTRNANHPFQANQKITYTRLEAWNKRTVNPDATHAMLINTKDGSTETTIATVNWSGSSHKTDATFDVRNVLTFDIPASAGTMIRYLFTATGTPGDTIGARVYYRWRL